MRISFSFSLSFFKIVRSTIAGRFGFDFVACLIRAKTEILLAFSKQISFCEGVCEMDLK
jgi:hypothetical protein